MTVQNSKSGPTERIQIKWEQASYSDVSIKNIDILPNWQYIANTTDSAQEQYS